MSLAGESYLSGAAKSAPPLAVSGVTALGLSLQEWVYVATFIYTVLQIVVTVMKFYKSRRSGDSRSIVAADDD